MPGPVVALLLTGLALARATDPADFDFCIATSVSDFANASAFCSEAGMDMVNPRSELENSWASAACDQVDGVGCWLGLTDQSNDTNSEWFWADGAPLSYSNWAEREAYTKSDGTVRPAFIEGNGGSNEHHAAIFPSADIHGTRYLRSWYDTVFGQGQFFAACQAPRGGNASLCSGSGAQFVSAAEAAQAAATAATGCGGEVKCYITSGGVTEHRPALLGLTWSAALLLLMLQ
jgi:hypothetical protein